MAAACKAAGVGSDAKDGGKLRAALQVWLDGQAAKSATAPSQPAANAPIPTPPAAPAAPETPPAAASKGKTLSHADFPGLTGLPLLHAVRAKLGVKGGSLADLLAKYEAAACKPAAIQQPADSVFPAGTILVADGKGGVRLATEADMWKALDAMTAGKKAA